MKKIYNNNNKIIEEVEDSVTTKVINNKRYRLTKEDEEQRQIDENKYKINCFNSKKRNLIKERNDYRKQVCEEWFDEIENMPTDIKDKCKKAKKEIKEIEIITKKEDLTIYNEL